MSDVLSKKDRPFVGRHDLIAAFSKAVENKKPDEHKILNFHGAAGIGKSTLLEKLIEELADIDGDARWALLNFETRSFRDMETALFKLRQDLKTKYKIEFPAFDMAYAVYWRKTRPQIPLIKSSFPFWDETGLLAELIKDAGDIPVVGLIPKLLKLKGKVDDAIYDWQIKRGNELLKQLPEMEPKDIEDLIPAFFAEDLNQYIEGYGYNVLIFLDTYEQLKGKDRSESERFGSDKWIRELIDRVPGALWVISGREDLEWPELDDKWKNRIEPNKVDDLEPEYADEYLEKCGIGSIEIRNVVVEGSKGLPLYLDLSVDTFIEIVKKQEPQPDDFGKTPRLIFERFVRNLDDHEVETLKALSPARFWDKEKFEAIVIHFNTGFPLTRFNKFHRFSFMKPGADDNTWRMHDLMRDAFLKYTDNDIINKSHEFLFEYYNNFLKEIDIKNIIEKQKTALAEGFFHGQYALDPEELSGWLNTLFYKFYDAAQWKVIADVYSETIEFFKNKLGKENIHIALALNNLALSFKSQGRYKEAELIYMESLDIYKKVPGEDHPYYAATLNNLAGLYISQCRYEEAEPLYKKSLEIKKNALQENHPDYAATLNNLAALYKSQGRYEEAEPLYKESLEIYKKALGEDHPSVATTLNNLAVLYESQGRYEEAEPLYKKDLEITKKALGEDHPDYAATLNNLALLYVSQNRCEEAEPLYKESLEIKKKALGEGHPDYAATLNNLALLYVSQNRYEEAELLYKESLEIKKKALGEDHPSVATTLNNLAGLYGSQGRYEEAEPLYKRDLEITKKALGEDHPDVAITLGNLAIIHIRQEKYGDATGGLKKALEIFENKLGAEHPHVARTLEDLYVLYDKMGRKEEAAEYLARAQAIRKKRGEIE